VNGSHRFVPRNKAVARLVLFTLTAVASGVTVVFSLVGPPSQSASEVWLTIVASAGLLILASALLIGRRPMPWLWATYPFASIAAIALIDISTHDASVTAQVFFFFPAIYAGAQVGRFATVAICAAAVVADAVVTGTQLPIGTATAQVMFVAAALVTCAALLVHAGERTDALVAQLEQQAAVDPLTGLLTRRVLDRAVTSALGGAGTDGGTALVMMDIDNFKVINDVHGHPAGDAVLQELAALLMQMNRRDDVISRMGGDEIAILLAGCPLETARRRAEEILLEVRTHVFDISASSMAARSDIPTHLDVSVSIGIAHLPTHAHDLRALYAAADASLYDAKKRGRDRIGSVGRSTHSAASTRGTAPRRSHGLPV
jgi:diguanylate cyclase (GGDEF)-like protein